jgi:rSAM/selenodomain-associated transferase 2
MQAPLSIILPTFNATDTIGPTLAALAEAIGQGLIRELIIADGGSDDEIALIADQAGARFATFPQGRGSQLAGGASLAQGSWLLFLHADTVPAAGWSRMVEDHLRNHPAAAACFRLEFDDNSAAARATAGWANLRTRLFGLPFGDQGLLVSRKDYERSGGFAPLALMEDVALVRRLPGPIRLLPCRAQTSASRYRRNGWLRQGARNLQIQLLYLCGVSPDRLARLYR